MGCTCGYSVDVDEPAEVARTQVQRARKPYRCCECRDTIEVGQRYEYTYAVCDKRPDVFRTCLICAEVRDAFSCDGSWQWGALWEVMRESVFEDLTTACEPFRACSPEARETVLRRWREWKGVEP